MSLGNIKNIGIVGGGISAVLLCNEAAKRGIRTTLLDADIGCLGAEVASEHMIGGITEENLQKLNLRCDAVIYNSNSNSLLKDNLNYHIYPRLKVINRLNDRSFLLKLAENLKIPVPTFYVQENKKVILEEVKNIDFPFKFYQIYQDRVEKIEVLKKESLEDLAFEIDEKAKLWLIEQINTYEKVIVNIAIKDQNNKVCTYNSLEKIFSGGALKVLNTPASLSKTMSQRLTTYTNKLVKELDSPGVYSVKYGIKKNKGVELIGISPKLDIAGLLTEVSATMSIYEQVINMILGYPIIQAEFVSSAKGYVFSHQKHGDFPFQANENYHIYSAHHNYVYVAESKQKDSE